MTGSSDFPLTPNFYLDTHAGFVSVLAWSEPNDPPVVTITSPTNDDEFSSEQLISFAGTATDTEDGDLTAGLEWFSSIDGYLGTGGSLSDVPLSDGVHTITASVIDSGGKTGGDSITITVGTSAQTIGVASIQYALIGGGNHLQITCTLNQTVEGAIISIELYRNGNVEKSFSGTTDGQGVASFLHKKAPSGSYTSVVIDVTAEGYEWDLATPPNSFTK